MLTILSAAEAAEFRETFRTMAPRGDVIVVGTDVQDSDVWSNAYAIGASKVVFLPDAEPWLLDQITRHRVPEPVQTSGHQHCTAASCHTHSHTEAWCNSPQPRRCDCGFCYPDQP